MLNTEYQSTPHPDQSRFHQQEDVAPVMSFADWFVIMLIMVVPILNFVMLITWSMDKTANPNRRNWALAALFFIGIQVVLWMFVFGIFMGNILHYFFSGGQSMGTW